MFEDLHWSSDSLLDLVEFVMALEEHFALPRVPDRERVAYLLVEIVDLVFMLSMREAGAITPVWLEHAKVAAGALFSQHFGDPEARPSFPTPTTGEKGPKPNAGGA